MPGPGGVVRNKYLVFNGTEFQFWKMKNSRDPAQPKINTWNYKNKKTMGD